MPYDIGAQRLDRRQLIASGLATVAATALPACAQSPSEAGGSVPRLDLGKRSLGALQVSSLGLGVQNMTRTYQGTTPDRAEMVRLIRATYDRGVAFFDTAEAYGAFGCELILGEAAQPFRDKVVVTSKFGWNIDPETGRMLGGVNSKPAHVRRAIEGSLRRLRTDRIDLIYQHRVDPEVPIEDVAGVIKDLKQEGKILHWGLCEMGPQTLRRAHAELPLAAVQCEYSLLARDSEEWIIPECERMGIGFVPFQPLGAGFLTGVFGPDTRFGESDSRRSSSRFSPENLPRNHRMVELVESWAARKGTTPAQIALAWLMAQKPWIVPIPGTTQMPHMIENTGATSVRFTPGELAEIGRAASAIRIQGERQSASILALSGVEAAPKVTP